MGYPKFGDRLTDMIEAQKELQNALGHTYETMTFEQKIQYIKDNVLAAQAELMEALNECDWKPWVTGRLMNEEAMFDELRDVWQFITNLMLVICPDPNTLATRLETALYAKHAVNYQRMTEGYDGRTTKCPDCRRALDDPAVKCEISANGWHCAKTGVTGVDSLTKLHQRARPLTPIELKPSPGWTNHCPVCKQSLAPEDTGFRAPELICDGTESGCKFADLT